MWRCHDTLAQTVRVLREKYGTWMYGLNKLYLLMEKQHNRGQEGAGLACVKLEANPGEEYMFRERALGSGAITEIFENIQIILRISLPNSCTMQSMPNELYLLPVKYIWDIFVILLRENPESLMCIHF